MTQKQKLSEPKLNGNVIIGELIRNMELGRFEMTYSVLLPCVFTIYLNPQDYATLSGVFNHIVDDARRALRARVAEVNAPSSQRLSLRKRSSKQKEFKIACRDWSIEFLSDTEVPSGDVEIHSELNEAVQPGYRGTKTTLMDREPSAGARQTGPRLPDAPAGGDFIYGEISYEDDSGAQVYLITQNRVRIGRGGEEQPMDLALYASDEVSREHLVIRRDPASGNFFIVDSSTNGTWLNGKRLRKGAEEALPKRAHIGVGGVLTISFEARS